MAPTANSTIGQWLADPKGSELLGGLLAQVGVGTDALAQVSGLPLQQLVALSQGKLPQETVDGLVLAANDGKAPGADDDQAGWTERLATGRFDGRR